MITLPEGITLESLVELHTTYMSEYEAAFKRARLLDGTDRGKLWRAIQAKFPSYQILPDTNHVSYIKSNLLASIYSVGRSPDITPTSENDKDLAAQLNVFFDHMWDSYELPYYQMLAGERAALLNVGYTQVGWDNTPIMGTGEMFKKGEVTFKNIDPLKFMRDPFVDNLHDGHACIAWDDHHATVLKSNKHYKDEFKEYSEKLAAAAQNSFNTPVKLHDKTGAQGKNYHKVYIYWVKYGDNGEIAEIHVADNAHVLYCKPRIRPKAFPIAELFCNIPSGDVIGTSEPNKIFANSLAYNLMNSISLTAEYKNQRPPRFVNQASGIDLRSFVKHGNDSDRTFITQGDASRAVHYHQFPQTSPAIHGIMSSLGVDIQSITGVTGRYTGQDSGSILTTGGMTQMVDQATMVDQPKVNNYERYARQLGYLVLANLIQYGKRRKYVVKDKRTREFRVVDVDFSPIKDIDAFEFALNISPHLPKNRARAAQKADAIMEKQMQYAATNQGRVQLISPEEWLMFQDLPFKEYMLERMGVERSTDYVEKVSQVIFQYAQAVDNGMNPEEALLLAADTLEKGGPENNTMGSASPMINTQHLA